MKSSQAFSLLRILQKTGVLDEVKDIRVKKHELSLKRTRLFDRIRFKHVLEIKSERDRLRGLIAEKKLEENEFELEELKFVLNIFDEKYPAEYDELIGYNASLGNVGIDYASIVIGTATKGEKELYQWIADYRGITVEDVDNDMTIILTTVEEVMNDPNLLNLFKSLNIGI